ncbi:MAG: hypothetical protein OK438_03305 [Thaumarchaeota archaeon]|nr:hypothetical protein [Nitrososphaerota archaeon]
MQNRTAPSISQAYLFAMASLLFGLPLLTAYYNVNSAFYFEVLAPYLITSVVLTFVVLVRPIRGWRAVLPEPRTSKFAARFNSVPVIAILGIFTAAVAAFGAMRYEVYQYYPYPPPSSASMLGSAYILLLVVTSILGFSKILYAGFPTLAKVLRLRQYAVMAAVVSLSFALVYLLLVNQILVSGFNVFENLPPPSNAYPFAYTFTVGIEQPFLNLVYLPYAIVQLSPQVNLLIIPFEMVFATLLGLLVASNLSMAHFLISRSGLRCSTAGTAMSAFGSVLGLTATCPTCLVPTFLSVIFGGLTAAETVYSNVYGAVIPPVVSVATLTLSLVYLSRTIRKRGLDSPWLPEGGAKRI